MLLSFIEKIFNGLIGVHEPAIVPPLSHIRDEPFPRESGGRKPANKKRKRSHQQEALHDVLIPDDLRRPTKVQRRAPFLARGLCDDCLNLDLERAFREADAYFTENRDLMLSLREWKGGRKPFRGVFVANLDTRIRRRTAAACRLCRLLASYISNFDEPQELRAFPSYWVLPFLSMDPKFFSAYDSKIQPSVLMVVPASERHPAVSESFTQENCIFRFPEDKDITTIHPRNLEPYVDLAAVKKLIEFCEQYHGPGCPKRHDAQDGIIDLPGFRVIDCNDGSIVGSSLRQPFVALSYVWGRRRYQASPDWPQVVTDAVEVTKALGFRYLWVDRYCIDQDNAEEKHNQITNMDSIYESAQLTIMAAAGENAEYGLPGVGRSRVVSEILKLEGVSVGSVPPDISRSVQSSVWWSRGWTYQEGVLSRRRLIFTDDQVYFQCNNMISYETFDIPLEEFHMASLTRQRDLIQPCIFTGDRADHPSTKTSSRKVRQDRLLYHIRNYSHRTLSFTSDGLNAFQGIISAIQLRTFYGLIVSSKFPRSEYILSKVNTCQSKTDGSIANFGDGMELAVALVSWWHETEMPLTQQRRKKDDKLLPIRLPDFPSWSWLGWRGVVHNTSSLAKIQNATTNYFEADIAGPELSLSLLSPRVFALFYIHKEDLAALLEPVVTLYHGRRINSAMVGGGSPLPKVPRSTKLTNWQWTMRGGPEPVVLRFKLSVAFNQRDLANKLFMGDIQVILMAQTDTDYVFLVVHGPGYTVYRRIGICLAQKGPAKKWVSRDRDSGSLGWAFLTPLLASIELH